MRIKTGLLVGSNPNNIYKMLTQVQCDIEHIVYIQFISEDAFKIFSDRHVPTISNKSFYKKFIFDCYKNTLCSNRLDIRVLLSNFRSTSFSEICTRNPIDIVYFDQSFSQQEMRTFFSTFVTNKSDFCKYISLISSDKPTANMDNFDSHFEECDNVVLGGTFDKLHHGHKILLSEAILRCRKTLTVGVTDNSMLTSKVLPELIEPCDVRLLQVKTLLEDIEPNLEYKILPIYDMYGPTKDDPDLQVIVVSAETIKGAEQINKIRKEKGFEELKVVSVSLLDSQNKSTVMEHKVSSGNIRIQMLGTLLREPKLNTKLQNKPYIIGLTGGIAAGKTAICSYIEQLGAKCINADVLGHLIYENDETVVNTIKELFGPSVIDELGKIDRKQLGAIVFNDKEKMNELNKVVWPAIFQLVNKELNEVRSANEKDIVVLEAAVLIQANWHRHCHEIWSSIIPREQAIKRLKERNNLTEEEAITRINAQPNNEVYVRNSHVVFSTFWDTNFTRTQIRRAWVSLLKRT